MKFPGINIQISDKAKLGKNVRIGSNVVIYDNVVIGDNSTICDHCVIGEPESNYYSSDSYENPATIIGENALIRSRSIIYSGVQIGDGFSTGHDVIIREKSVIGNHCSIGTRSDLQGHLSIGNYCRLHSNVHLCQFSQLGDFVFVYPNVVLANDKYPPSEKVVGPKIGDYTQIGVQSTIIGDVSIGSNCLIGASSTVAKSFKDYSFILGAPAMRKSDVRELLDAGGKSLYPWKNRFSRNMPWHP